ncbi:hypothetical protein FOZ63_004416, partial [Perkinsus olseni]
MVISARSVSLLMLTLTTTMALQSSKRKRPRVDERHREEDPLAERLGHLESQMSELIGGMSTLKSIVSKQGDAMNRLAKFTRDVHIFDSSCDIEYFDSYFSYDRTDDGEYRLIWSGREPLLKSITFELKPTGRMSISYSSNKGRAQIAGPSEEITKSFHE